MKTDWDKIKAELSDETTFEKPLETISNLSDIRPLPNEILHFILDLKDTDLITEFLFSYNHFTHKHLSIIEKFIRKQITTHEEPSFKFDLIDFAAQSAMQSLWEICLDIVANPAEDNIVILGALIFLYERMQICDLPLVYSAFEKVLNSEHSYQNCQTAAAFFLYRMTFKQEYFDFLTAGIALNGGINREVLKNLLQEEYHQKPYFAAFDNLKKLLEAD